jgi:hypothetical protein
MRTFLVTVLFLFVEAGAVAHTALASEQPIWTFSGKPDGANPSASVVVDANTGIIYGVTVNGGSYGYGTVFQLTPPATAGGTWSEQILYSFQAKGDGQNPNSLIENSNGDLYGTTLYGGSVLGAGVVFKLSKAAIGGGWNETIVFNCGTLNIAPQPAGNLLLDNAGNLYATIYGFGTIGVQVVEFGPPSTSGGTWAATPLYSASYDVGGGLDLPTAPGLLLDNSTGSLYGSLPDGGPGGFGHGNLFHLSPPGLAGGAWSYSDIYDFDVRPNDGILPFGGLVLLGGGIYGTTGGGSNGLTYGTVFQALPPVGPGAPWTESVLYGFAGGASGGAPLGGLIAVNGALYGTTSGYSGLNGTIFMMTPSGTSWVESNLYNFQGGVDGTTPTTALTVAPNSSNNGTVTLYGTTFYGGANNDGTVFEATVPLPPPAPAGTEYRAVCNLSCFENSAHWKIAPPVWVLGPEAVVFDGTVVQVSDGGRGVEVEARMLGGLTQSPLGIARTMRITFDRDGLFKDGQHVSIAAQGPVIGLSPRLQLLGVWRSEPRLSTVRK